MEEDFIVTYSASNKKTVSTGTFDVTLYEPLKNVVSDITGLVEGRIDLEEINSISIDVKLKK